MRYGQLSALSAPLETTTIPRLVGKPVRIRGNAHPATGLEECTGTILGTIHAGDYIIAAVAGRERTPGEEPEQEREGSIAVFARTALFLDDAGLYASSFHG